MVGFHNNGVDTEKAVEPSLEYARRRRRMEIQQWGPNPVWRRRMTIQQLRFFSRASSPFDSRRNKHHGFEISVPIPAKLGRNNDSGSSDLSEIMTSVCGKRGYTEDVVSTHLSFKSFLSYENQNPLDFYGVYDGHGCSHVAMKCKDRMHEIFKEELDMYENHLSWPEILTKSFSRMDKEITEWCIGADVTSSPCLCELQTSRCDIVGSTAIVVVISSKKIIVSNCGDSRAVIWSNGTAIPLSVDHKPDRPDELARIEATGGQLICKGGAKEKMFVLLGISRAIGDNYLEPYVISVSRAIGDNYLKPYVISEPEVTITERNPNDECLIIANHGLWDVVSNEMACYVAWMCLQAHTTDTQSATITPGKENFNKAGKDGKENSNKACTDASILLTRLALARHTADNVTVLVVDLRRNL